MQSYESDTLCANYKTNLLNMSSILIRRKVHCAKSERGIGPEQLRSLFFVLSLWATVQNVRSPKRIILRGNYFVGGWWGSYIPEL